MISYREINSNDYFMLTLDTQLHEISNEKIKFVHYDIWDIWDIVCDEMRNLYFISLLNIKGTMERKIIDSSGNIICDKPREMIYSNDCLFVVSDNDLYKIHLRIQNKVEILYKGMASVYFIACHSYTENLYIVNNVQPYFQKITKEGILSTLSICNKKRCDYFICDDILNILIIIYDIKYKYPCIQKVIIYDLKRERIHSKFSECIGSFIGWNSKKGELYFFNNNSSFLTIKPVIETILFDKYR